MGACGEFLAGVIFSALAYLYRLLAAVGRVDGRSWGMKNRETNEETVGIIQARDNGTKMPIN